MKRDFRGSRGEKTQGHRVYVCVAMTGGRGKVELTGPAALSLIPEAM